MASSVLTRMLFGVVCGLAAALCASAAQAAEQVRPNRIYIPGAEPVAVYPPAQASAPAARPYGAPAPRARTYGMSDPDVRPYGAPEPNATPYGARQPRATRYGARAPSLMPGAEEPSVAPYSVPAPRVAPYGALEPVYDPRYYSAEPGEEPEAVYVAPRPIAERTRNYFRRQPVRKALRALAP